MPTVSPKTDRKPAAKRNLQLSEAAVTGLINAGVVLAVLAAAAVTAWHGYQVIQPQAPAVVTANTKETKTAALPALQLNHAHQRQGQAIQAAPESVDRTNPFK